MSRKREPEEENFTKTFQTLIPSPIYASLSASIKARSFALTQCSQVASAACLRSLVLETIFAPTTTIMPLYFSST